EGRRPDARRDRRSRHHLRPGNGRARHRAGRVHDRPEARPPRARPARPYPRLRHAEQPREAPVRGPGGGGLAPGRPDARDGPAGQTRERVAAGRLVQRLRRRDPGLTEPDQLLGPLSAQLAARVARDRGGRGLVYSTPGGGYASSCRYDVEGFGRFTGEASVRAPFPLGTTFGVRLFGGAYAGRSAPVPQRRIPIAGADPYETFTNPLLRSA